MLNDITVSLILVGFVIYKLKNKEDSKSQLGEEFFKYNAHSALSDSFVNAREVTGRFRLSPGSYIIIPSTYHPGTEGEFLLRAFKEKLRDEKRKKILTQINTHKPLSLNGAANNELDRSEREKVSKQNPEFTTGNKTSELDGLKGKSEHSETHPDQVPFSGMENNNLEKQQNEKEEDKIPAKTHEVTSANNTSVMFDSNGKSTYGGTHPKDKTSKEIPEKRQTIHHFKYEKEDDEKWACITSHDTTCITIKTTGTRMISITIMDHVKRDI